MRRSVITGAGLDPIYWRISCLEQEKARNCHWSIIEISIDSGKMGGMLGKELLLGPKLWNSTSKALEWQLFSKYLLIGLAGVDNPDYNIRSNLRHFPHTCQS